MKKLLFLAAAFVTGFTAMAQDKATDVLKPDVTSYSFGKIKQNVPVVVYFTVKNISDKPAAIENAWAECGCTTPEYNKQPIPAGGEAKIKVGYNAASMGEFNKGLYLKLAGVAEPLNLKITGQVVDAPTYDAYTKTAEFKKAEKVRLAKLAQDEKAFNAKKTGSSK